MESELNIGREIQMSMVPAIFPPFPDRTDFTIHAILNPAREVGGDFYDFFLIDEDHLCFAVGDVSGKGVASALFMAVTKTLIKSLAKNDKSPASIMTGVNDELSENNESCMFVTIWLAVLNLRTGAMATTNAGHNPPYLRRKDDSIERLANRHGPIVGARGGIAYREDMVELRRGDLLLLYTDGVTEATSVSDELFSEERLEAVLRANDSYTVEDAVAATVEAVNDFEGEADQYDDITVMALRFEGIDDEEKNNVLELVIKNELTEIERVNSRFNEFAEQHDLPKAARQKTNIALDELLNNAITYAFGADSEHTIEITIALTGQRLVITLIDSGQPFNPFTQKEPDTKKSIADREIGGLGIQIVRKIMDDVSYERRINRNVVKLVKNL
jgi:anti-sigma regulatory factor (Ser/Thr protein kinase)